MTDALIVGVTGFINLLLGGFVLARNSKSPVHRLFAAFSVSIIIWTSFNFLADQASSNNLLFTRLTFVGAALIAVSLFQLSNVFPTGKSLVRKKIVLIEVISAGLIIVLSLTPLLIPEVLKKPEGGVELEVGPLYGLYILYIMHTLVYLTYNFHRRIKRSSPVEKSQIRLLLVGIVLYAIFAIASNLLLPLFMDNWTSSRYGPIFTLLFVAFTAYAIIRHRLLDIRLIVARSIAYLLLASSLTAVYAVVIFGISERLFNNDTFSFKILPISTALLLAFTTPYLRKRFDKLTNRVFYRDAYDPQLFLDELNKILVSNLDLEKLLSKSASTIERNLKAEYCGFIIRGKIYASNRGRRSITSEGIVDIQELLKDINEKVISTEDLLISDDMKTVARQLKKKDIEILARLVSSLDEESAGIGYVIIGPKSSGNLYNNKDLQIFEIVANELVIAIENALRFEEIEQFNITLQEEVEDATKQLRHTNEKLKALDETKDEFISMASHQLRTPLTSVKGYVSMVLEGDAGELNEQQRKLLTQAFNSSQRMVYLIADLLNVSRLRTGKFVIEQSETYLPDVIEGELEQLKETANAKGLVLSFDKPEDFPALNLDETKTRQVIMNFVDNAIYYTPSGGKIRIELESNPKAVEFRVVDTGLGVPKKEQHHLFTKFYRAENARKARPDGTGLGLFMAKKVVIAQGGAIIFKSAEGKGSTFGFQFPRAKLESGKKE